MGELTNVPGADLFAASIGGAVDAEQAALLGKLLDWAVALEADGLCQLESGERANAVALYPRLPEEGATIAYVWNLRGTAQLYVNGTVITKASQARSRVEAAAGRALPGNGMVPKTITDELLNALTEAYREAAGKTA